MATKEAEIFIRFTTQLKDLTRLEARQIEEALKIHEGLLGVLRDEIFILGYEQLGWLVGRELSVKEIALFGTEHSSVLTQDEGAMYFFVQALMEKRDISNEERLDLIYVMPKQYQKYLMKRFGFHPIPYS